MGEYQVLAIQQEICDEVRATGKSPGFGHPAIPEVATGTGPCRSCLGLFGVGEERRLLFTYQPPSGSDTMGAPGPVFVHTEECVRFDGQGFPADLKGLPLIFEARTQDGRVLESHAVRGEAAEEVIEKLLGAPEVDFLFVRHGEAGCHIARVARVSNTA